MKNIIYSLLFLFWLLVVSGAVGQNLYVGTHVGDGSGLTNLNIAANGAITNNNVGAVTLPNSGNAFTSHISYFDQIWNRMGSETIDISLQRLYDGVAGGNLDMTWAYPYVTIYTNLNVSGTIAGGTFTGDGSALIPPPNVLTNYQSSDATFGAALTINRTLFAQPTNNNIAFRAHVSATSTRDIADFVSPDTLTVYSGVTSNGWFFGNGSGLTSVNASTLTNIGPSFFELFNSASAVAFIYDNVANSLQATNGASFVGNGIGLTNIPYAKKISSTNATYAATVNSDGSTNYSMALTNVPIQALTTNGANPAAVIGQVLTWNGVTYANSNAAAGGAAFPLAADANANGFSFTNANMLTATNDISVAWNGQSIGFCPGDYPGNVGTPIMLLQNAINFYSIADSRIMFTIQDNGFGNYPYAVMQGYGGTFYPATTRDTSGTGTSLGTSSFYWMRSYVSDEHADSNTVSASYIVGSGFLMISNSVAANKGGFTVTNDGAGNLNISNTLASGGDDLLLSTNGITINNGGLWLSNTATATAGFVIKPQAGTSTSVVMTNMGLASAPSIVLTNIANGGLSINGSVNFVTGILGNTAGSAAAATYLGEVVTATVTMAAATSFTTSGTSQNLTSISLKPGSWMVGGTVTFIGAATTIQTYGRAGINNATATLPNGEFCSSWGGSATGATNTVCITPQPINVSSTTTEYLNANCGFSTSTMTMCGNINAVRIR